MLDVRARGDCHDSFIEDSRDIPAGRQLALRANEVPCDRLVVVVGDDGEEPRYGEWRADAAIIDFAHLTPVR